MPRSFRVCLSAAIAAGILSGTLPAQAAPKKAGNALGVIVVRFQKGLGSEQMKATIVQAGGEVVSDLSRLNRMTAVPVAADFATRIRNQPMVAAAWADKVYSRPSSDLAAEDAGVAVGSDPQLGNPGPNGPPDPWHDAASFLGENNPEGVLQWDDRRMGVPAAWAVTTGSRMVRVAVLDTGVQGSHKELLANYDNRASANTIPCNLMTRQFGPGLGQRDCSSEDTEGHGTWVASRIAGAANGFASNGVAPNVQIVGMKVLSTTLGGGLTSWIVDGMMRACDANVDLINMSLGGYDAPGYDDEDYMMWVEAVNYCRAKGTAILASAGNEHVRIHRVNMMVGGQMLVGVGRVDTGSEGIQSIIPPDSVANNDLRGLLETPAGVPGVIMVSATGNAIGGSQSSAAINAYAKALVWPDALLGKRDQLTYYSNYGSRIDIAAPGGARKFNIPRYDVGAADILYGGWGTLGALTASGEICTDPASASLLAFACFKVQGAGFGWLQGTSMSSPNATGVAALTLAARSTLKGNPDGLLARLKATARTDMVNYMGPNDPANLAPTAAGVPCATGWCHINRNAPIAFTDAYGAGIVNAGAAVAP
jgi:subtilisin family serine protease